MTNRYAWNQANPESQIPTDRDNMLSIQDIQELPDLNLGADLETAPGRGNGHFPVHAAEI